MSKLINCCMQRSESVEGEDSTPKAEKSPTKKQKSPKKPWSPKKKPSGDVELEQSSGVGSLETKMSAAGLDSEKKSEETYAESQDSGLDSETKEGKSTESLESETKDGKSTGSLDSDAKKEDTASGEAKTDDEKSTLGSQTEEQKSTESLESKTDEEKSGLDTPTGDEKSTASVATGDDKSTDGLESPMEEDTGKPASEEAPNTGEKQTQEENVKPGETQEKSVKPGETQEESVKPGETSQEDGNSAQGAIAETEESEQTEAPALTSEELEDYRTCFKMMDKDGDGTISVADLLVIWKQADEKLTEEDIAKILDRLNFENGNCLNFKEFIHAMYAKKYVREDSKLAFAVFDKNVDGCLDREEVKYALAMIEEHVSVDAVIKLVDTDRSGTIDMQEFLAAMDVPENEINIK